MKITIIVLLLLTITAVLVTGNWGAVSGVDFFNSNWGLYNKSFFENLLVEVHGGIIDLAVVGVILFWFDKRKVKKETIEKAKTRLTDLSFYCGSDAAYKLYGSLKYLLSLGVDDVAIPGGNLSKLKISDLKLVNSNLIAVNFSGSNLNNVQLESCNMEAAQFIDSSIKNTGFKNLNLKRSKFINAELKGMDFRYCELKGATFKNCSLQSANFSGVDCSNLSFKGSNLRSANFIEARNLTRNMILESSNYEYIKLPNGFNI